MDSYLVIFSIGAVYIWVLELCALALGTISVIVGRKCSKSSTALRVSSCLAAGLVFFGLVGYFCSEILGFSELYSLVWSFSLGCLGVFLTGYLWEHRAFGTLTFY